MSSKYAVAVFSLLAVFASVGDLPAQTVAVGSVSGLREQTIAVPVRLTATAWHTAALVRVQYNPAVLENARVTSGPLLSMNHTLDAHAPAAGRLNVMAYGPSGMPSFTAGSGTLFHLTFRIKATAPSGLSNITFTAVGAPTLPNAELVTVAGASVAPIAGNGYVRVVATEARPAWSLYP